MSKIATYASLHKAQIILNFEIKEQVLKSDEFTYTTIRLLQLLLENRREAMLVVFYFASLFVPVAPFRYGYVRDHCHLDYHVNLEEECHEEIDEVI